MADKKISALTAASTPLAGTEVLPIVQSSTTKQVSVANLTAGRAISASTVTATTTMGVGAATPAASGAGITFPATQSVSSDVNTLDDYEEGTFTAGIAFGGASVGITYDTTPTCTYTKIGMQVTVTGRVGLSSKGSSTGAATITGLPFTPANTGNAGYGVPSVALNSVTFTNQYSAQISPNSTSISLNENTLLGAQSSITDADFNSGSNLLFTSTYFV
jgi:hypothetical protein